MLSIEKNIIFCFDLGTVMVCLNLVFCAYEKKSPQNVIFLKKWSTFTKQFALFVSFKQ